MVTHNDGGAGPGYPVTSCRRTTSYVAAAIVNYTKHQEVRRYVNHVN